VSFEATKWAWKVPVENSAQRLVLLNLADRANKAGICWPAQKRIAADTGLGERTVRAKLAELEALALLTRKARIVGTRKTSDLISLAIGGNTNGSASASPKPPAPAAGAAPNRQSVPADTGSGCRLIYEGLTSQIDPKTHPDNPRARAFWIELMPMPDRPDIDRENRAAAFATAIAAEVGPIDWNQSGFESLKLVEDWLDKLDRNSLRQCLLDVAARAARAGTSIRSWRYFANAVDELVRARSNAPRPPADGDRSADD
jgi:Helix-turn-helix domain